MRLTRRLRQIVIATTALAATGAAPLLLLTVARHVLHGPAPWSGLTAGPWQPPRLSATLHAGTISNDAVIEVLARFWLGVAWFAYVRFLHAVASEARQLRRPVRRLGSLANRHTLSRRAARHLLAAVVTIPTAVHTAGAAAPPVTAASIAARATDDQPIEWTYVVQRGDSYWNIAERELAYLHTSPPTEREVLDQSSLIIYVNAERLGDRRPASRLYAGDTIVIPPPIGDTIPPPADHARPAPSTASPAASPPEAPMPPSTTTPPHQPTPTTPQPTNVVPSTAPPDRTPPTEAVAPSDNEANPDLLVPILAGGGAALAAGTAYAYHRHRARTTPPVQPPEQGPPPPNPDDDLDGWLRHHLTSLVGHDLTAIPVAIEASTEHGAEILWSEPQPHAAAPWTVADSGWAWRLPPTTRLQRQQPDPFPGLVHLGRRDGRELYIELEAYGTFTIAGPGAEHLADHLVRQLDRANLVRCSTADELDSVLDQMRFGSKDEPTRSTLRDRAQGRRCEPLVVIVAEGVERITVPPYRGIAVMLATDAAEAATIALDGHGGGRIEAVGVDFTLQPDAAIDSSAEESALVDLEALRLPVVVIADPAEVLADQVIELPVAAPAPSYQLAGWDEALPADPPQISSDDSNPAPLLVVRVLGAPQAEGRPDIKGRELQALTFLACQSRPCTASALQDALWGARPIEPKTLWNMIGSLRRSLGKAPDGASLLSATDRATGSLCLDRRVTTDLHQLQSAITSARSDPSSIAIETLGAALDHVTGQPFNADGYDWAHHHQHVTEAENAIEAAAIALTQLALDANNTELARSALRRALRGIPGNEALYRQRMRIEHHIGNHAGVKDAYNELTNYLQEFGTTPSAVTVALRNELLVPAAP